jgi:hypothetical protein
MLDDFLEFWVPLFLIIAGVILAISAVGYYGGKMQCETYQEVTGRPTKYVAADCYVKDQGQWYQWDEYKNRLVAQGHIGKGN